MNDKQIGNIHFGTEQKHDDANIVHINLNPAFYMTKYLITEVISKIDINSLYIRLESGRDLK